MRKKRNNARRVKRVYFLLFAMVLLSPVKLRAQDAEELAALVGVLKALLAHAEDAADQNLPLMYWYATESVVAADRVAAAKLLTACQLPKVRQFITRRMPTGPDAGKKE